MKYSSQADAGGSEASTSDSNKQVAEPSCTSSGPNSQLLCCWRECEQENWMLPPSLRTSSDSTVAHGVERFISSLQAYPANHIAVQESDVEKRIAETCGQTWHASLEKWIPSSSLSRTSKDSILARLRTVLKSRPNSTGWVMLSSSGITALPRKGLRTRECGPSRSASRLNIPTPSVMDSADIKALRSCTKENPNRGVSLTHYAMMFPTPTTSDATTGAIIGEKDEYRILSSGALRKVTQHGVDGSIGLARYVKFFPTPTADSVNNRTKPYAQGGTPLTLAAQNWPTPTHHDHKGKTAKGREGSPGLPNILDGKLNPDWVEWLMGFPTGWTAISGESASKLWATRSSRKSRKASADSSKRCVDGRE